ncbi:MAG: hypothetical protein HW406_1038 [Candidatus Brocadiaceae bacterium]|nr:hypothetical protein [Candidatus Brocadiaceae bacterium]
MHNFVVIVSSNVEVYKSLERAFRVSNITAWKWDDYIRNKPISNAHPILIFTENRDSLYEWIWNDIRGHSKLLNPIIAVSFHLRDPTNDLRDLVFEKRFETYQYFKIPFLLEEVFQAFKELKSLRTEKERKHDIKSFSQPSGLLNKVEHELMNLLGSEEETEIKKERAIRFYTRVKEMLQDLDSRNELMEEVEDVIFKIEKSVLSDEVCRNFKLTTDKLFLKIRNEL